MAEENAESGGLPTEAEGTEAPKGTEDPKGVTVEELQAQLEVIKSSQAGSDSKVTELVKANQLLLDEQAATKKQSEDSKKTQAQKNAEAIEAISKERDDEKLATARQRLENVALKHLSTKNIPVELDNFEAVSFLVGDDEEKTTANVEAFGKYLDAYYAQRVKPSLRANGRTPMQSEDTSGRYYTIAEMQAMSPIQKDENRAKVTESVDYWSNQ